MRWRISIRETFELNTATPFSILIERSLQFRPHLTRPALRPEKVWSQRACSIPSHSTRQCSEALGNQWLWNTNCHFGGNSRIGACMLQYPALVTLSLESLRYGHLERKYRLTSNRESKSRRLANEQSNIVILVCRNIVQCRESITTERVSIPTQSHAG